VKPINEKGEKYEDELPDAQTSIRNRRGKSAFYLARQIFFKGKSRTAKGAEKGKQKKN
jgi:hypothetical protein